MKHVIRIVAVLLLVSMLTVPASANSVTQTGKPAVTVQQPAVKTEVVQQKEAPAVAFEGTTKEVTVTAVADLERAAPESKAVVTIPTEETLPEGQIQYNGVIYQRREDLTTLLIMGLDKFEHKELLMGYTNAMQADFFLVAVIDETSGSCALLHLNRDTMAKIRRLGIGGDAAGSYKGQLALSHTYGSGGSDSSLNAVWSVKKLLGDVPIDHYLTLTMDAVGKVTDLVGGVTVTVLHDFGAEVPELKVGEQVTLRGDLALTYVREKMTVGDGSNLQRMERQQQYLEALITKLVEKSRTVPDFLRNSLLQVNDSFTSDLTVNQLQDLADTLTNCEVQPIRTIPGEAIQGEFMEFYPDQEALMETIVTLFYEKAQG